jgi:hypothetical protein
MIEHLEHGLIVLGAATLFWVFCIIVAVTNRERTDW